MKIIFTILLFIGTNAFATSITPISLGVQMLPLSVTSEPFINYSFTIKAKDFPSMDFSSIRVTVVNKKNNEVIVSPRVVYSKSISAQIVRIQAIVFSIKGREALLNLKHLNHSKIIFDSDNGSTFSIDLERLCKTNPSSFINLNGGLGCDMDMALVNKLLKDDKAKEVESADLQSCNEVPELKELAKVLCIPQMKTSKKRIEGQYTCEFVCD